MDTSLEFALRGRGLEDLLRDERRCLCVAALVEESRARGANAEVFGRQPLAGHWTRHEAVECPGVHAQEPFDHPRIVFAGEHRAHVDIARMAHVSPDHLDEVQNGKVRNSAEDVVARRVLTKGFHDVRDCLTEVGVGDGPAAAFELDNCDNRVASEPGALPCGCDRNVRLSLGRTEIGERVRVMNVQSGHSVLDEDRAHQLECTGLQCRLKKGARRI
eukprot:Amastigsp_a844664_29.p2 type:complete len:217 gc:universal Amastigsp_a844664_29:936-286(-)